MKNTLFIFDIDGTLTDSVDIYIASVTKAMQTLGISNIDTNYNTYLHHTDSYALRYNYEQNFNTAMPVGLLDDFETALLHHMSTYDPVTEIQGAKSLLQFLRDQKIAFCFATGALPKTSVVKLTQCDIWYDEKLLATSKTHESREGFVADAIERAKRFYNTTQFDRLISIGDGLWDLKTAQNLSLEFVGVGNRNKDKLIANGAKIWVKDLEEFKELLL